MATPNQAVKAQYGTKADLVTKLVPLLDREPGESEADFKDRLSRVSNKKLLRLMDRVEALKAFGSRETLIDKIVELRKGDTDLRQKMQGLTTGRLLSLHTSLARKG